MTSAPWLELSRTVRFSDTDAAGVMHFQKLLDWCHQAWEESLECFGLPASYCPLFGCPLFTLAAVQSSPI